MTNDDFGKFTFTVDHDTHSVTVQAPGDANLPHLMEVFEAFLVAAGFDQRSINRTLLERRVYWNI